ncbi:MAG: energy transducer TonB [Bacteroidota bacterium]
MKQVQLKILVLCSLLGRNDPLENISPSQEIGDQVVEACFFSCYFPPVAKPLLGYDSLFSRIDSSIKEYGSHQEGKVYLGFIVDIHGQIKDAKVIKGVNPKIDHIALTSFNKLNPKFDPAQDVNGRIEVRMIIPIRFEL